MAANSLPTNDEDRQDNRRRRQVLATLTISLERLDFPLLETSGEWVVHGFSYANYLDELGETAQNDIYSKSSVDNPMRDVFRKTRQFLMRPMISLRTRRSR
jgi:hypothetical protein